jgi:hypothetical protein
MVMLVVKHQRCDEEESKRRREYEGREPFVATFANGLHAVLVTLARSTLYFQTLTG